MGLAIGTRLGPYEILSAIGAGGMGEVYRAKDTRLKRDIALKILPDAFATDADRLARFQREAEVLAALNHPTIASIYGFEESNGVRALVMELVEGETLADRIARGPIPIDEALPIAKQIAEALEAAHEQGIIHRDLKPANIKVRPDGTVKVLDFGLAKLAEPSAGSSTSPAAVSMSPTITSPALVSGVGVLLGTAAYMSPEQAKGRPADKRSDIWAFGCVLYEMLTGTRAFEGDDIADTLAAVLRGEPDWNRLPKTTPPAIRRVLRRCLAKERTRRLSAIDAVRLDIEELPGEDVTRRVSVPPYQRAWVWASLAAIAVIAAVASWATRPPAQPPPSVTFAIPAPPDTTFANGPFSLSPDGKSVAFIASGPDRTPRIWIRSLASLDARAIGGTEGAGIDSASGGNIRVLRMVWSPDSRALAFVQQGRLRKIELATGGAQTLCDSCGEPGSWGRDGIILISGPFTNGSILRLPASGGSITAVAVPNRSGTRASQYQFPSFLPDGKHFVFIRTMSDSWTMFIGSVDNPPDRQESLMLTAVTGQTPIAYVGDETGRSGHLLFMQDDTLVAQAFDTDTLAFTGDPVPVVESVGRAGGGTAFFAASSNGLLAFRNGSADRVFIWYGTDGKRLRSLDAIRPYTRAEVQLSPDGTQLITTGPFPSLSSWIIDVNRGLRTRIAPDGVNAHAVWSRDGARIAYSAPSAGKWALSLKPSNGSTTEKVVWQTDTEVVPNDWSSDGRYLLYSSYDAKTKWDLWVLAVDGKQPPMPVARTTSTEVRGQFSPDQRWIAYESDESGERQIHVKPFVIDRSADDRHWTIDAGAQVRWSRDGKRLFYRRSDAILSVDVTSNDFRNGAAKTLFSVYGPGPGDTQNAYYDVSADGQRFIVTSFPEQNLTAPITVLLNWRGLLAP